MAMNHFGQSVRYFVKTVELGSLTLAAGHFAISQSAISQQLSALEKELGSRLFLKKDKTGILLSPAGEILYQKGKLLLEEFDGLVTEIKGLNREGKEGGFTYGVYLDEENEALRESFLSYLASSMKNDPSAGPKGIRQLLEKLDNNKLDGVFTLQVPGKLGDYKELACKEIAALPLKAAFSSYSFFGSLPTIEGNDLSKFTFVQDEESQKKEAAVANLIGIDLEAAFPRRVRFMSRFDALEEVKNNRGFLLCNPFDPRMESEGLKDADVLSNGVPLTLNVYLIWNKKNPSFNPKMLEQIK